MRRTIMAASAAVPAIAATARPRTFFMSCSILLELKAKTSLTRKTINRSRTTLSLSSSTLDKLCALQHVLVLQVSDYECKGLYMSPDRAQLRAARKRLLMRCAETLLAHRCTQQMYHTEMIDKYPHEFGRSAEEPAGNNGLLLPRALWRVPKGQS